MTYHYHIIPSARLEGTLKEHLVVCRKERLCEIIWHPLQLLTESLWLWGLCHIPGEVPGNDRSHKRKKKSLFWVEILPGVACLLHVSICRERASILFVATLQVLEQLDEVPINILFCREKNICLFQSCLVEQILQTSANHCDPLFQVLESLSMPSLMSGNQNCTHHSRCCLIGMMRGLSLLLMPLWLQLRFWLICWCSI